MSKHSLIAIALLFVLIAIALSANTVSAQCTGICSDITSPYVIGTEIAAVAVLLVVVILAIIYMLSPLLGYNQMRTWVRTKIYDEFASLVFIFIFIAFGALVATLPVQAAMSSVGLTNSECDSVITSNPQMLGQPISYDNLYFMSLCDVYQFNNDVNQFAESTFYIATLVSIAPTYNFYYPSQEGYSAILPQVLEDTAAGSPPVVVDQEQSGEVDEDAGPDPVTVGSFAGANFGIMIAFNFMPIQPIFHYFTPLLNTLYLFFILSQVQLLLIAASGIIFAILMAVGLIARSFGITRTFGGAMIAFAIGIGVIYPLMTAVTYGFITHAIDAGRTDFVCAFSFGLSQAVIDSCPPPYNNGGIVGEFLYMFGNWAENTVKYTAGIFGTPGSSLANQAYTQSALAIVVPLFRAYVLWGALIAIGISFIPLLNLTVVDVFIVDFSLAIGERMDFLSLLTRLV